MADIDLGTARGKIEIDTSTLARSAAALDLVGNKMLLLGGVAAAAFGYAVKSAAEFETQLSRFGAVADAGKKEMEEIRQKALQLGRDSAYGATEVVKAFAELAYAGATTKEIISGLGDATVFLAAAGEIPLADASTTLINTMRQFGIDAKDAVDISNELARAANASTISIEDLNTSLRYVGPVAAAAGISFNSTAEALAILGNEGIRGSTAGTSLRGILVGITKPSIEATAKMKELGIITKDGANQFFTATGEMKSFKDIAQILQNSVKGLTKEQELNALGVIFQRRAMASAAVLAREGAAGFDKLTSSAQYNTTAQELMKKKLDNVEGSIKILKASLQTAAITLGELFTPYIKGAADALKELVNWFIQLPKPVKQVVGFLLVFAASFLLIGGTMAKIGSSALKAYQAFKTLGGALKILGAITGEASAAFFEMGLALLTNPVFLVIAAIALLALGFYELYQNSATFRRGVKRIWAALQEVWQWIQDNWDILLAILLAPFTGFFSLLYPLWKEFGDDIERIAGDIWDTVSGFFEDLYNDVTNWVEQAVTDVIEWFEKLPGVIGRALERAFNAVVDWVASLPAVVGHGLGFVLGQILGYMIGIPLLFWKYLYKALDIVGGWISDFLTMVINWGVDLIAEFIDFLSRLPGILLGFLVTMITTLGNWVNQFITWVINLGVQVISTVIQFFSQLPGLILNFLTNALSNVIGWVGEMIGTIINLGVQVLAEAWNFFSQLPGTIINAIGDAGSMLWDVGVNIIQGLIDGMTSIVGEVGDFISNLGGGIVSGIGDALDSLSPSRKMMQQGYYAVKGLAIGLEKNQDLLKPGVKASAESILGIGGMAKGMGTTTSTQNNNNTTTQIIVNNPVAQTAEESLAREMQKLAYTGVAG